MGKHGIIQACDDESTLSNRGPIGAAPLFTSACGHRRPNLWLPMADATFFFIYFFRPTPVSGVLVSLFSAGVVYDVVLILNELFFSFYAVSVVLCGRLRERERGKWDMKRVIAGAE